MTPTIPDRRKLVWIIWKDAVDCSSRVHTDCLKDVQLATNTNIGWIVEEDAERVVLAHGFSTTLEIDHFAIPVSCIVRREPVVMARKRAKNATAHG
jgi:hypothetical protein